MRREHLLMPRWLLRSVLLLAFLIGTLSADMPAFAASIEAAQGLDTPGASASDPTLASDGGALTGCAWISRREDLSRVVFRERIGTAWAAPEEFGGAVGVNPSQPQLLYDSSSEPHLIWREADPAGKERLMHASRRSGFWFFHGPVAAAPQGKMADPAAMFDEQGNLHVAWREGSGSFWQVRTAAIETSGTIRQQDLTAGQPAKLYLYPSILQGPRPRLCWFEDNGQINLQTREWDATSSKWVSSSIGNMPKMPLNRLPFLLGSQAGALCGVWYDLMEGSERVFWGISGPETLGEGVVVDEVATAPGSQPFACWSPDGPLVAWKGQSGDKQTVLVRKLLPEGWTAPASVETRYPSHPRVAANGAVAHVAWLSDANDGGDGNIYATAVQW